MIIVLDEKTESIRAEQVDSTIAGGGQVNFTQMICEPREGEGTASEHTLEYHYSSPNQTTLNAIREIEMGDVVRCRSEKDLFRQLHSD